MEDLSPIVHRCIHCGERVRSSHVNEGEPVECPTCWWVVRFSPDEIHLMARAIDSLVSV